MLLGAGAVPLLRPADARRLVATARGPGPRRDDQQSLLLRRPRRRRRGAVSAGWRRARATTPCRAGSPSAASPSPSCPAANAWPSTSTRRSIWPLLALRARHAPARSAISRPPPTWSCRGWSSSEPWPPTQAAELLVFGRSSSRTPGLAGTRDGLSGPLPGRGARPADGTCRAASGRSTLGRLLDVRGPEALALDRRRARRRRHPRLEGPARGPVRPRRGRLAVGRGPLRLGPPAGPDVADPWLRALTSARPSAAIPIVLGGHSIVGPGLRWLARAGAYHRGHEPRRTPAASLVPRWFFAHRRADRLDRRRGSWPV